MKKLMMISVLSAVLAGCSGVAAEPSTVSETVTKTETQTRTAEPSPAPSTTEPSPASGAMAILDEAWDAQTQEDRDLMCWGWEFDQEIMLDSFFVNPESDLVTRDQARAFFDGKCS